LLRRYWHAAGLVTSATDIPRKVRVLGEDLVLLRDRPGRAGPRLCPEFSRSHHHQRPEPIKKEFVLSDTTMGLPADFGFVLFSSLVGIPITRCRPSHSTPHFAFWSPATDMRDGRECHVADPGAD